MTKTTRHQSLRVFVRSRRRALGLSAYAAAERAGLHRSYWSKLEAGEYDAPSPKTLEGIAAALKVPLEQLYTIVGYETPQRLPNFRPYLRARYHLPHEAVVELERYFKMLRSYYGIPDNQSVFPPKPKAPTKPARRDQPKRRAA